MDAYNFMRGTVETYRNFLYPDLELPIFMMGYSNGASTQLAAYKEHIVYD
jgi:hypothetical protein